MALKRNDKDKGKFKSAAFGKTAAKKSSKPAPSPFKKFFKEKPTNREDLFAKDRRDPNRADRFAEEKPDKTRFSKSAFGNKSSRPTFDEIRPRRYAERLEKREKLESSENFVEKKDFSAKPPLKFSKREDDLKEKSDSRDSKFPFGKNGENNFERKERSFDKSRNFDKKGGFDKGHFERRDNENNDFFKPSTPNEIGQPKRKLFNDDYFSGGSNKMEQPYGNKSQENYTNRPAREDRFDAKDKRNFAPSRDSRDSNFSRESRDSNASRDSRDSSFSRDSRDSNFSRDSRDSSFSRDNRDASFAKDQNKKYGKNNKYEKPYDNKTLSSKPNDPRDSSRPELPEEEEIIRLNKFLAQSGLCSRRKAAEIVKAGEIKVNGVVEVNPAYETKPDDIITHKNNVLKKEERMVYVLMNKPKNTITTAEDEKGRKTVLDLIGDRYNARIFPVGRLDRNTTGLLLLTNDGDLAKKLSHPSHQVKKVYQVELDINVKTSDFDKIKAGLVLDDGVAEVDAVDYIEGGKKNEVGIEIHSGKNRIVRRIFESLGYEVVRLDRSYYGGLTKKDLPRGFTRELNEKEIIMLKHFTNQRKKEE